MQESLDPKLDSKLMKRLLRPIEQPGVIDRGMSLGIVERSQRFANRLPLVSHLTQRLHRTVGFQDEKAPIVYARSLPQANINPVELTTAMPLVDPPQSPRGGDKVSSVLSQPSSSSTAIVQAKFMPGNERSGLGNIEHKIDNRVGESSEFTSESLQKVEGRSPLPANINPVELTTAMPLLDSPQSSRRGGKLSSEMGPEMGLETFSAAASSPTPLSQPSSNSTAIVQAKFMPGNERSGLENIEYRIDNRVGESSEFTSESLQQVEGRSSLQANINPVELKTAKPLVDSPQSPQRGGQVSSEIGPEMGLETFSTAASSPTPLSQPSSNSTTIVQAKFMPGNELSGLENIEHKIDNRVEQSSEFTSERLQQVEGRSSLQANINPVELKTAKPLVDSPQSPQRGGKVSSEMGPEIGLETFSTAASSPTPLSQPSSNSTAIVQAKFMPGSERSGLENINNRVEQSSEFTSESLQQVERRSLTQANINPVELTTAMPLVDSPQSLQRGGKLSSEMEPEMGLETFSAATSSPTPLSQPSSNSTAIVQAKFMPGNERSSLENIENRIDSRVEQSSEFTPERLQQVEGRSPLPANINPLELTTPMPLVDPPQSPRRGGKVSPVLHQPSSSSTAIVQAKFHPDTQAPNSSRILPIQTPIPKQLSKPNLDFNLPNTNHYENLSNSEIKNRRSPQSQNIWSGLETPLIFSAPSINTDQVKTESVKTELNTTNSGITGRSRTENWTQTADILKNEPLAIQPDEQSNIQEKANDRTPIDLEALTDKIERNLMQRLIIESERRGRNIWS
jgi:hypothetical protein